MRDIAAVVPHMNLQKLGVEMPITEQLNKVLFEGGDAASALTALMGRPQIYEQEEFF